MRRREQPKWKMTLTNDSFKTPTNNSIQHKCRSESVSQEQAGEQAKEQRTKKKRKIQYAHTGKDKNKINKNNTNSPCRPPTHCLGTTDSALGWTLAATTLTKRSGKNAKCRETTGQKDTLPLTRTLTEVNERIEHLRTAHNVVRK